jgi:hypothetical protein
MIREIIEYTENACQVDALDSPPAIATLTLCCSCMLFITRILKPVGSSRGRGIHLINSMADLAQCTVTQEVPVVVQRYLTSPLLVQVCMVWNKHADLPALSPLLIWKFCSGQALSNQLQALCHICTPFLVQCGLEHVNEMCSLLCSGEDKSKFEFDCLKLRAVCLSAASNTPNLLLLLRATSLIYDCT